MPKSKRQSTQGPYEQIIEALLARNRKHRGHDYICPAHDDHEPSLGVTRKNGKVLVNCSAGCATKDVLAELGMTMADLNGRAQSLPPRIERPKPLPTNRVVADWANQLKASPKRLKYWTESRGISTDVLAELQIGWDPTARAEGRPPGAYTFPYRDASGHLLNVKKRFPESGRGKTFRLVPGQPTDFLWPEEQLTRHWVVVCEGESDALRAISLDLPAVTAISGAGGMAKAARQFAPQLAGMHVIIATDSDNAGRKAARETAQVVAQYASQVLIWDPFPKRSDGSDLSDWFDQHDDDVEAFQKQIDALPAFAPTTSLDVPDRSYFFPQGKFVPPRLGRAAEDAASLRKGPGKGLWRYAGGVYVPDGDDWLNGYVRSVLDEEFREGRLREVRAWCRANFENAIPTQPSLEYINVANGLLYWQQDPPRLVAHSPDVPSITRISAEWDPDGECPAVMAFLEAVLPDDCGDFIFEWIGYLLIPTSQFQRALMLEGPRDTGKSTLLGIIERLLGGRAVSHHTLQSISDDRFTPADLYGRLANIYADLDARSLQNSGRFKAIVAGDSISAEHKYGDPFSFRPFVRLIFSANEPPGTADQSDAYYKRFLVLPMHRQFSVSEQDARLSDALTTPEEMSGLLARSVEGLRRLIERGRFDVPKSMRVAAKQYRENTDTVVAWGNERLIVKSGSSSRVQVREAFANYQAWCEENNRRALGRQRFKEHVLMAFKRLRKSKLDGYDVYVGVELKA